MYQNYPLALNSVKKYRANYCVLFKDHSFVNSESIVNYFVSNHQYFKKFEGEKWMGGENCTID